MKKPPQNIEIGVVDQSVKDLVKAAFDAVSYAYDGSEAGLDKLISALMPFQNYVRSQNECHASSDLERAYAKAAGFGELSTNDLLDEAARNFYTRLRQANEFDTVLSLLEKGGAHIIRHTKSMVLTDDGRLKPAHSDEPEEFEGAVFQPRLAQLVEYLAEKNIYADDMIVRVEKLDPGMMRKRPYIILEIPRIQKQIAVCDQLGEITFVADEILPPAAWEGYSKSNLKSLTAINTECYDSAVPANWLERIGVRLFGEGMADAPKPKIRDLPFEAQKAVGKKSPLSVEIIVEAAVQFHARTSEWPTQLTKERILEGPLKDMAWSAINAALRVGSRGLPGGSSLPIELEIAGHRKNQKKHGDISLEQILKAAVQFHARTSEWPSRATKERIPDGALKDMTWLAINSALRDGSRGLPRGSSLADELEIAGHKKNQHKQADITVEQIEEAAVQFHGNTGKWPSCYTKERILVGPLKDTTWGTIQSILYKGGRGLPGGSSLADVLQNAGHKKNQKKQADITMEQIVEAAIQFHGRTNKSPSQSTKELILEGPLKDTTWSAINSALRDGSRGLPRGSSLADVLEIAGHKTNQHKKADITVEQIVEAAVQFHGSTGKWPSGRTKERIPEGPLKDTTWGMMDNYLRAGGRGLPRGSSLADVLDNAGHKTNQHKKVDITVKQILEAAVQFNARRGEWPTVYTKERIPEGVLKGMAWGTINSALHKGCRGLPGGSSLAYVL